MGKRYIKDGKVYEEGGFFQEDKEMGEIKSSWFGSDYIEGPNGEYVGDIETNLRGDEHKIIEDRGWFDSTEKGTIIKDNPFSRHGSDSIDYDTRNNASLDRNSKKERKKEYTGSNYNDTTYNVSYSSRPKKYYYRPWKYRTFSFIPRWNIFEMLGMSYFHGIFTFMLLYAIFAPAPFLKHLVLGFFPGIIWPIIPIFFPSEWPTHEASIWNIFASILFTYCFDIYWQWKLS